MRRDKQILALFEQLESTLSRQVEWAFQAGWQAAENHHGIASVVADGRAMAAAAAVQRDQLMALVRGKASG